MEKKQKFTTTLKSLKELKELNQKLADKYGCKISIGFGGKETVLADGRKKKQ